MKSPIVALCAAVLLAGCDTTGGAPLTPEQAEAQHQRRAMLIAVAVEEVRIAREAGLIREVSIEDVSMASLRVTYGLCATMRLLVVFNTTVEIPEIVPTVLTPWCNGVVEELGRRASLPRPET